LGAHWQAILGLRYTDYRQKDLDGDPEADSGYRKKPLTPTVALVYKPIDSMSVYGSYVESLEAGSRVSEPYANAGQILDPTVSRQYEIGAKYEASRVVFTTAAFRIERAAEIDVEDGEDLLLVRDGLTRYQGIEAMGNFSLAPRLQAGLGLTYLDARIEDVSAGNPGIEGNRPGGAARWQLAGNIDYALAAVPGLGVHAAARYFGNAYYSDSNQVLLPARTLVSVGAQYDTSLGGHKVVFTGNINNLFNRKYWELNTLGEGINGALGVTVEW
jgi:iron complex outermembrane receptor protein